MRVRDCLKLKLDIKDVDFFALCMCEKGVILCKNVCVFSVFATPVQYRMVGHPNSNTDQYID